MLVPNAWPPPFVPDEVHRPIRVVQWATGNIGRRSLRGVIEHPSLELTGVLVYSPEKAETDAGELCGLGPCGVVATDDVDEIVALGADCALYMPRAGASRRSADFWQRARTSSRRPASSTGPTASTPACGQR